MMSYICMCILIITASVLCTLMLSIEHSEGPLLYVAKFLFVFIAHIISLVSTTKNCHYFATLIPGLCGTI